jgi:hypothetical protein
MMRWETLGTWDWFLKWLRERNGGGLWVGGTLVVYDDRVQFRPNIANKALQTGKAGFDLPWREVGKISWRSGVLTNIIELQHGQETEAVRCFGAKKLAEQMRSLQKASAG